MPKKREPIPVRYDYPIGCSECGPLNVLWAGRPDETERHDKRWPDAQCDGHLVLLTRPEANR